MLLDRRLMVLGPAPPLQDGTQRRKDYGGSERREGERWMWRDGSHENEWILFDSGDPNVWLSPAVNRSFLGVDWWTESPLAQTHTHTHCLRTPPSCSISLSSWLLLFSSLWSSTRTSINADSSEVKERAEGWLVLTFNASGAVSSTSARCLVLSLFMLLVMYLLGRATPFMLSIIPLDSSPLSCCQVHRF